jgi:hypothetical protein
MWIERGNSDHGFLRTRSALTTDFEPPTNNMVAASPFATGLAQRVCEGRVDTDDCVILSEVFRAMGIGHPADQSPSSWAARVASEFCEAVRVAPGNTRGGRHWHRMEIPDENDRETFPKPVAAVSPLAVRAAGFVESSLSYSSVAPGPCCGRYQPATNPKYAGASLPMRLH